MILGIIFAVASIILDQLTKFLIYGNAPVSIVGNVLWFHSTFNTGVAFGMFKNGGIVFILLSSVASIVLIYLLLNKKVLSSKTEKVSLGLILGGTIGNLIDRISFGGVRDFIYLKFIDFAIFNFADMCVVFGVLILCSYILFKSFKKEDKKEDKKKTNDWT